MKRVKHVRVNWPRLLLAVLALVLVVVGVLAVIKWISLGKAKHPAPVHAEATAIPMMTEQASPTEPLTEAHSAGPTDEPTAEPTAAPTAESTHAVTQTDVGPIQEPRTSRCSS